MGEKGHKTKALLKQFKRNKSGFFKLGGTSQLLMNGVWKETDIDIPEN